MELHAHGADYNIGWWDVRLASMRGVTCARRAELRTSRTCSAVGDPTWLAVASSLIIVCFPLDGRSLRLLCRFMPLATHSGVVPFAKQRVNLCCSLMHFGLPNLYFQCMYSEKADKKLDRALAAKVALNSNLKLFFPRNKTAKSCCL
jgi:hypothetical protein